MEILATLPMWSISPFTWPAIDQMLRTLFSFPFASILLRPRVVDLSFIVIFYTKSSYGMCWLFDYFFIFIRIFFATFFQKKVFKRSLNTRRHFTNDIIKWKTKQSWKGNLWRYLFILPIFFLEVMLTKHTFTF